MLVVVLVLESAVRLPERYMGVDLYALFLAMAVDKTGATQSVTFNGLKTVMPSKYSILVVLIAFVPRLAVGQVPFTHPPVHTVAMTGKNASGDATTTATPTLGRRPCPPAASVH